jgi:hypothetical protein
VSDGINGNGGPIDPALQNIVENAATAPVNQPVINALQGLIDMARRGKIHSIAVACVDGTTMDAADSIVAVNMVHGLMLVGAMKVIEAKIAASAIEQQQKASSPASRLIRPGPGMRLG